jgi:hypothetical protein
MQIKDEIPGHSWHMNTAHCNVEDPHHFERNSLITLKPICLRTRIQIFVRWGSWLLFYADADPYSTYHFDADPDPD